MKSISSLRIFSTFSYILSKCYKPIKGIVFKISIRCSWYVPIICCTRNCLTPSSEWLHFDLSFNFEKQRLSKTQAFPVFLIDQSWWSAISLMGVHYEWHHFQQSNSNQIEWKTFSILRWTQLLFISKSTLSKENDDSFLTPWKKREDRTLTESESQAKPSQAQPRYLMSHEQNEKSRGSKVLND